MLQNRGTHDRQTSALRDKNSQTRTHVHSRDIQTESRTQTETLGLKLGHTHETRGHGPRRGGRLRSLPAAPAPRRGCRRSEVHDRQTRTNILTTTRPEVSLLLHAPGSGTPGWAGGPEATAATSKNRQLVATCWLRAGGRLSRR